MLHLHELLTTESNLKATILIIYPLMETYDRIKQTVSLSIKKTMQNENSAYRYEIAKMKYVKRKTVECWQVFLCSIIETNIFRHLHFLQSRMVLDFHGDLV